MTLSDIISVTIALVKPADAAIVCPSLSWEWNLAPKHWGDRSEETILETAFYVGNHGSDGARCRSVSVGDIVTIKVVSPDPSPTGMLKTEDRHYRCEGCGWSRVSGKAISAVRAISSRDASFPLTWLAEHGYFPAALLAEVSAL